MYFPQRWGLKKFSPVNPRALVENENERRLLSWSYFLMWLKIVCFNHKENAHFFPSSTWSSLWLQSACFAKFIADFHPTLTDTNGSVVSLLWLQQSNISADKVHLPKEKLMPGSNLNAGCFSFHSNTKNRGQKTNERQHVQFKPKLELICRFSAGCDCRWGQNAVVSPCSQSPLGSRRLCLCDRHQTQTSSSSTTL